MIRGITELEGFLRVYAAGILGVLVDHVESAREMGARVVEGSHGRGYVVVGRRAYPILCGDIVRIETEDGPSDGRCGRIAQADGACPVHAAQRDYWQSLSEAERVAVEREEDARF
jgi:hypothetical protein